MKKRTNKKCICGKNRSIICATCSRIKMVILLKKGNTAYKYKSSTKGYSNPVWYSTVSKNNNPVQLIINSMYKRFEKSIYKGITNKVIFYDNYTKELLISM